MSGHIGLLDLHFDVLLRCYDGRVGGDGGGDGGGDAGKTADTAARNGDDDGGGGDGSTVAPVAHCLRPTARSELRQPSSAPTRRWESVPAIRRMNWLSVCRRGLAASVQPALHSPPRAPLPRPEVQRSSSPCISSKLDLGHT